MPCSHTASGASFPCSSKAFLPEAGSDHGNFQGEFFSNFTNKHQSFQSFSQYSLHYLQQYMLESTANDTNLINLVSIRVA